MSKIVKNKTFQFLFWTLLLPLSCFGILVTQYKVFAATGARTTVRDPGFLRYSTAHKLDANKYVNWIAYNRMSTAISQQLATKADAAHLHAGIYEPRNPNIQGYITSASIHVTPNQKITWTDKVSNSRFNVYSANRRAEFLASGGIAGVTTFNGRNGAIAGVQSDYSSNYAKKSLEALLNNVQFLTPVQAAVLTVNDAEDSLTAISTTKYLTANQGRVLQNSKQATVIGAASSVVSADLPADKVVVSSGTGKLTTALTTATELSYLQGVNANVQTQLNAKLGTGAAFGGDVSGSYNNLQVIDDSHMHSAGTLPLNTATQAGLVPSGAGQANKVYETDGSGVPGWRVKTAPGSPSFDTLLGGTNTSAAFIIGTNSSMVYGGGTATSGAINANQYKGSGQPTVTQFDYLKDLSSPFGTAATKNIGTVAGTVADGGSLADLILKSSYLTQTSLGVGWPPVADKILFSQGGSNPESIGYQIQPSKATLSAIFNPLSSNHYNHYAFSSQVYPNSGHTATVASFGQAVSLGTHRGGVWGGNFVAYNNGGTSDVKGVEINFGKLQNNAVSSIGLLLTATGSYGNTAHMVLSTNSTAARPTDGILFNRNYDGGNIEPTTTTLIKTSPGVTVPVGIDFSGATFTQSAMEFPSDAVLKGGTGKLRYSGTGSKWQYSNDGTNWLDFGTSTGSQWTTTGNDIYYNTGKVGLGTATPGSLLSLKQGTTTAQNILFESEGLNSSMTFRTAGSSLYGVINSRAAGGTLASLTASVNGQALLNISAGGHDGTIWRPYQSNIYFRTEENWTSGGAGTAITFETTKNADNTFTSVERLRINNNGDIGIGTALPTYRVDISTPNRDVLRAKTTYAGGIYGGVFLNLAADPGTALLSGNRVGTISFEGAIDAAHNTSIGATISSYTENDLSSINQGQNVQIGTTPAGYTNAAGRVNRYIFRGDGGFRLIGSSESGAATDPAQPACDANTRGTFWLHKADATTTTPDHLDFCGHTNVANTYAWKAVVTYP